MHEQRFLRFANVDGPDRRDIAVAADIWMDEVSQQTWVSRDTLQMAALFKRYLQRPDPRLLEVARIKTECDVPRESVTETLRQIYMYGVLTGYAVVDKVLRVSLHLSILQRLGVFETSRRFAELRAFSNRGGFRAQCPKTDTWLPPQLFGEEAKVAS